jgi:hypothetical protein
LESSLSLKSAERLKNIQQKEKKMKKVTMILLMVLAVVFAFISPTLAEDLGTSLAIVSTNIPPGADAAGMGNVWVATPEFSTNNPAAMAAASEFKVNFSGTYARINFDKGPGINLYSGSVTGKLPVGTLQVSYSDANFGRSNTLNGSDLELKESPSFNIQYGLRAFGNLLLKDDDFYLGANFSRYNSAYLFIMREFGRDSGNVDSKFDGYSLGVGLLYKPHKNFNFGAYYARSWDTENDKADAANFHYQSEYLSNKDLLRIGASWQVLPMTMIAVDYQYWSYQILNNGGTTNGQFFAGIEQGIIKDLLYIYGGWAGQGPTAGIGLYFKHGGVNFAYMNDPFPEASSTLGRGQVWMATIFFKF